MGGSRPGYCGHLPVEKRANLTTEEVCPIGLPMRQFAPDLFQERNGGTVILNERLEFEYRVRQIRPAHGARFLTGTLWRTSWNIWSTGITVWIERTSRPLSSASARSQVTIWSGFRYRSRSASGAVSTTLIRVAYGTRSAYLCLRVTAAGHPGTPTPDRPLRPSGNRAPACRPRTTDASRCRRRLPGPPCR